MTWHFVYYMTRIEENTNPMIYKSFLRHTNNKNRKIFLIFLIGFVCVCVENSKHSNYLYNKYRNDENIFFLRKGEYASFDNEQSISNEMIDKQILSNHKKETDKRQTKTPFCNT